MRRKEAIIINGVAYWECPSCKRVLPDTSYYSSKRTSNGLTSECRNCHIRVSISTRDRKNKNLQNREYMRRMRKENHEKIKAAERIRSRKRVRDIRYYARQMVHNALKIGILIKPILCEKCNKELKLTAHHEDYSKPLEVNWLCYECHGNK